MHFGRIAPLVTCALVAALLGLPSAAIAATPPTLVSPAAGAKDLGEGATIAFTWRGVLQGEEGTTERSHFRVEIAKVADVPEDPQAEWTALENVLISEPGVATTELESGVPTAGQYRWRVCAWGVLDQDVANEIQQLPGGCSTSRAFTTVAAANSNGAVGELKIVERTQAPGRVEKVFVERPAPERVAPAPRRQRPVATPVEPEAPTTFQALDEREATEPRSSVDLGSDGLIESRQVGSVLDGLGGTLPLIPIPFWTLALLLACFPIARMWRRSVAEMFEWPDGSIDGLGSGIDQSEDLATIRVASGSLKAGGPGDDGGGSAGIDNSVVPAREASRAA